MKRKLNKKGFLRGLALTVAVISFALILSGYPGGYSYADDEQPVHNNRSGRYQYAMLLDNGDVVCFRCNTWYDYNYSGTITDTLGRSYTGKTLCNISYSSFWFTGDAWTKMKRFYVAEPYLIEVTNNMAEHRIFYGCKAMTYCDLRGLKATCNDRGMPRMFMGCESLETLIFDDNAAFDTSAAKDMTEMFSGCKKLKNLDMTKFDTGNVTSMSKMFYGCESLESIDLSTFDTSSAANMDSMFYGCKSLKNIDVSTFETGSVSNMNQMFRDCNALESLDLSMFDTSSLNNMFEMFRSCSSMTDLDLTGWDTSSITTMQNLFYECRKLTDLDLSMFDTSKVTEMNRMFYECNALKDLNTDGWDTSAVTNMGQMFYNCKAFEELDLSGFRTPKVADMTEMFSGCSSLSSLDVSGFDTSSIPGDYIGVYTATQNHSMHYIFNGCSSLSRIALGEKSLFNIKTKRSGGSETLDSNPPNVRWERYQTLDKTETDSPDIINISDYDPAYTGWYRLANKVNITGEINWVNDTEADRPESVTVILYKGKDEGDQAEYARATVTPDADGYWTFEFKGAPKYDSNLNNLWRYSFGEEGQIGNYKITSEVYSRYDQYGLNGWTGWINNRWMKTAVSGKKEWVDGDNAAGLRPDSVTVQLLRDGAVISEQTITEDDDWAYSFGDLPVNDADGSEYKYTVKEKGLMYYNAEYEKNEIKAVKITLNKSFFSKYMEESGGAYTDLTFKYNGEWYGFDGEIDSAEWDYTLTVPSAQFYFRLPVAEWSDESGWGDPIIENIEPIEVPDDWKTLINEADASEDNYAERENYGGFSYAYLYKTTEEDISWYAEESHDISGAKYPLNMSNYAVSEKYDGNTYHWFEKMYFYLDKSISHIIRNIFGTRIEFKSNGGEGTMEDLKLAAGEEKQLTENSFTRSGYTFTGWNTKEDGSGNAYEDKQTVVTEDLLQKEKTSPVVLYAQWKAAGLKIIYDPNGGNFNGSTDNIEEVYDYGTQISIHDAPQREGYKFLYWKGSEYQPGDSYTVTEEHTFVAQWEKVQATDDADPGDTGAQDSSGSSHGARTGDERGIGLWLSLMLAAAAALAGLLFCRIRISRR